MKRFHPVWVAVAGLAIANKFIATTGFIIFRKYVQIHSAFRLKEAKSLTNSLKHNVSSPHVFGNEGPRKLTRPPGNPKPQLKRRRKASDTAENTNEDRNTFTDAHHFVRNSRSLKDIDRWMQDAICKSPCGVFDLWSIRSQIDFVKLLQEKKAYDVLFTFLQHVTKSDVKVYTTAMFALALSVKHRHLALNVLNILDERGIEPTSLTFIALLGSVDGAKAVTSLMKRIYTYKRVELSEEVFNSAIFACKRRASSVPSDETSMSWQTAFNLLQVMRRRRIKPTVKTYHALLQALGGTGQVQMAKSLLQQLHGTIGLEADDRVWAAAINVCAEIGDYQSALEIVQEMNTKGHYPNLLTCSILLKAFSNGGQDSLALQALDMMVGRDTDNGRESGLISSTLHIPQVPPDRIALNTIISACAKAGNLVGAVVVLDRMKQGEFVDPVNGQEITPDLISYHNVLKFCCDPELAMNLVKEMRLSRRNRKGVVVPTSVTYAHAINSCQRAESPSAEGAAKLLKWALDDDVTPTVYMLAPAIWAAQKSGDRASALNFFIRMTELGCSPNSVAYNGVISALCDSGDVEHAILLFEEQKERGMSVNAPVMKRFAKAIQAIETIEVQKEYLERIVNLMDRFEKRVDCGGVIFVMLIGVYGSLGLVDDALKLFYGITGQIDATCLRSILLICSIADPPRWQDAVTILHTSDIVVESAGPGRIDQGALSNAIMACSKANEYQEAFTLLQLYGRNTQRDPRGYLATTMSVASLNALIAACGRGGKPDLSLEILSSMEWRYGVRPDSRTYRNVAIACNKAQHDEMYSPMNDTGAQRSEGEPVYKWWECALALLRRMREDGHVPDVATYSATISACESAGEWQRALGVLQSMLDDANDHVTDQSLLNLYCFNAAISACEKGNAWVEALELYERMLEIGGSVQPNVVTLNSLLESLENAGQKELATSKYIEGRRLNIVNPWRQTKNTNGEMIRVMDLHNFSGAMAKAAVRTYMDGNIVRANSVQDVEDLVIISGKGRHSKDDPVLRQTVLSILLDEFSVTAKVDESNQGRVIVPSEELARYISKNRW